MSAQYISIYNDNSTKRKLFSKHEEIKWDKENSYLFLEDWRRNDAKMEIEMCDTECLGQIQLREKWGRQWTVTKIRGKILKKKIKKTLFETQNTRFSRLKWIANKSPGLAAKSLKDKIVKKFLSVFRDWKVYPRGSCELSHENLYVPLTTGPFTRKQVAKINTWACGCSMRLGWPATESPKQGNTIFENFQFFVKTKYFPKTPKTLKNLFVFESTKIEYVKTHFIKYNHTNEYGIHWI